MAVDSLTDHVVEETRIDCSERDQPSPRRVWEERLAAMWSHTGPSETARAREHVYQAARGCNLFNPVLAKTIYDIYSWMEKNECERHRPVKVLDVAAGWGDRLVAAAASSWVTEYVGYDPNPALRPVYGELYNRVARADFRCQIQPLPLEDDLRAFAARGPRHEYFDLVIASPPFFDQELYVGQQTSTNRYRQERYYYPMLEVAARALVPGGYLAGYLPDKMYRKAYAYYRDGKNGALRMQYVWALGFRTKYGSKAQPLRLTYLWHKEL